MPVFQVFLNGKKVTTAGVGNEGMVNALVHCSRVKREDRPARKSDNAEEELSLQVGGVISRSDQNVMWLGRKLNVGDEVCIRITENATVDRPCRRERIKRPNRLRAEKRIVRELAKKFGWKIQTR